MSEEKVKVFTLAKQYGFKSAEFVKVLRDIGFPVSSYQASLDTWDVPVIEQRLLRGGLIARGQATTLVAEPEAKAPPPPPAEPPAAAAPGHPTLTEAPPAIAAEEAAAPDDAAALRPQESPAATAAGHLTPTKTPPAGAAAPAAAAEEAAPAAAEAPAAAPAPLEGPAAPDHLTPTKATLTKAQPVEETPAAAEIPAPESRTEPPPAEPPRAEPPAPAPAAAVPPPPATAPPAPARGKVARLNRPEPPKPKPRSGATKVGKIDLNALGLVKQQQEKSKRDITFSEIRDRESQRRQQQRTLQREKQKQRRGQPRQVQRSTHERKSDVVLETPVTVKSFSLATGIGVSQVMARLMKMGVMTNINAALDDDTVELLAAEFDIGVRLKQQEDLEESLMEEIQSAREAMDDALLAPRPAVVTFMGHVDHGKTSLIDAIRNSRVAAGEAGGITQHIGAYTATTPSGKTICILDTPGHEAFAAMRARGARTTDIAVLVVAADDGIMAQTEEAAAHAREAGVPVIVAVNKIDAPGASPDRVRSQLAGIGLQPEEWGGSTGVVETSALRKTGIDTLLERIALEAEVLDLKAHPEGEARGVVIEALVSEGKGKVAHVLVQDGTLHTGDVMLAGQAYGKVRRLVDHFGKAVQEAGPSTPVEVLGLNELPNAGDYFYVVGDLDSAKEVAERRMQHSREAERAAKTKAAKENIFERIEASALERVRLVVKADVQGTLEVLRKSLPEMSTAEVVIELVHSGVGAITESDVLLAATAGALVVGFNVSPDGKASRAAEKESVEILRYNVIYELFEELERRMTGLLAPEKVAEVRGHAEVLQLFKSSRYGTIAGCRVTSGVLKRSFGVRVQRDGQTLFEGEVASLRRFKDDVREVKEGNECGLVVKDFPDLQPGDVIEAFELVERARSLDDAASSA